jgi:hypothetical protein
LKLTIWDFSEDSVVEQVALSSRHPFYSANDFFRQRLGTKLVKLALDGGFTCPNRDGTLSDKGCIFCSGQGSGDFAGNRRLTITEQIESMKSVMSAKWGRDNAYMAYFQAFTNTYAPIGVLRERYYEAINCPDIRALSVATRPDCINAEVISLLKELAQQVYVCVELGLQTSNDKTAELINRCYKTEVYAKAVDELKTAGIDVVTHIILGLPGESNEDMLESARYAADCGSTGIKLQLLHILKGTYLAQMYSEKPFKIFTIEEYAALVTDIIERLPQGLCIHRITGDGDKRLLVEPWWSLDKRRVLNLISRYFIERNTYQGIYCGI